MNLSVRGLEFVSCRWMWMLVCPFPWPFPCGARLYFLCGCGWRTFNRPSLWHIMFRLGHQCDEAPVRWSKLERTTTNNGRKQQELSMLPISVVGLLVCFFFSLCFVFLFLNSRFEMRMRMRHASGVSSCALFQFLICSVRLDVLSFQCWMSQWLSMCAVESNVLSGLSDVGCRMSWARC